MTFEYERQDVGDLTPENMGAAKAIAGAMIVLGCLCGAALLLGIALAVAGVLA